MAKKKKTKRKDGDLKRWDVLLKKFNKNEKIVGAEVGVWTGKMSQGLLKNNKNLFLYMIDRWVPPGENDSYYNSDITAKRSKEEFNEAYKETVNKVKQYRGRYKIIKKDSIETSKEFEDESLDFVFIDGDHTYEGVKKDINAWFPKVKKGGYICGHDYKKIKKYDGLRKAVDEYFGHENTEKKENSTWFFKK